MTDFIHSGIAFSDVGPDQEGEARRIAEELQAARERQREILERVTPARSGIRAGGGGTRTAFQQEGQAKADRETQREGERRAVLQRRIGETVPGAVLGEGQIGSAWTQFLVEQPNRELIFEKAAVIQKTFGISPDDMIMMEASPETGGRDAFFIKDPNTGQFVEFDSPSIIDLADLGGGLAASGIGTAEGAAALLAEVFLFRGAGFLRRTVGQAGVAVVTDQGELELGRQLGVEQSSREESLTLDRAGLVGGAAVLGEGAGEIPSMFVRRQTLQTKAFENIRSINIEAQKRGLVGISPAEVSTTGRSLAKQSAVVTTAGRTFQEDRLGTVLDVMRKELDVTGVHDMSTKQLQRFVSDTHDALRVAAKAKMSPGHGPLDNARALVSANEALDESLDTLEDQLMDRVREQFKDNNLTFDTTPHRTAVSNIQDGKILLGQNATSPIVNVDQPTGEFNRLLNEFLEVGDQLPVVQVGGVEHPPLDAIASWHRRARQLVGTGNRDFNEGVSEFIDILETMMKEPVTRGGRIRGTGGVVKRVEARGPQGQFKSTEVPPGFSDNMDEFLKQTTENTALRDSLVVRLELDRALRGGRLESFGRDMIDPRFPDRIGQIETILNKSGRGHQFEEVVGGYQGALLDNPAQIENTLQAWSGIQDQRLARRVLPGTVRKDLQAYSRNVRLLETGPIARTANSMDELTRSASLDILSDDTGQLTRLLADNGGTNGPVAKALRFSLVTDMISRSRKTGIGGGDVVDIGILNTTIRDLRESGNLDLLFPGSQKKFLEFLPKYLQALPGGADVGASLIGAELGQGTIAFMGGGFLKTFNARRKQMTNMLWTAGAYASWRLKLGVRDSTQTQNLLRAWGVGGAAQLREFEESIQDMLGKGILLEEKPSTFSIEGADGSRTSFEMRIPKFLSLTPDTTPAEEIPVIFPEETPGVLREN